MTTEPNEALKKAREEEDAGLAAESPLLVTPPSIKNRGGAVRMDTFAKLLESLAGISYEHVMAGLDIATGWKLRRNPAALKTSKRLWGEAGGMSVEEANAHAVQILEDFNLWWATMTIRRMIDKRNIAIGICAEGRTFTELGNIYNRDRETVKQYAIDACDIWVQLNNPPRERQKPERVERKRGDFVATRIVIFSEENV